VGPLGVYLKILTSVYHFFRIKELKFLWRHLQISEGALDMGIVEDTSADA
jgi:hypothetical protein